CARPARSAPGSGSKWATCASTSPPADGRHPALPGPPPVRISPRLGTCRQRCSIVGIFRERDRKRDDIHPAGSHPRRCPAGMGGLPVQPPGPAAQPGAHGLGRHRRAAHPSPRPGAVAGRRGQGLRRPRGRTARGGHRAARTGHDRTRARPARRRRRRTGARAGTAGRAAGGLPRPQGRRELRAAAARPGRGRGVPAVRAPLLQRRRARLQRRGAARAGPAGRAQLRLHRRGVLPGRRRQARRGERGAVAVTRPATGAILAAFGAAARSVAAVPATLVLLAILGATPAQARERIVSYDQVIEVRADGSLDIVEDIRVRAEGSAIRRGIYRDFPTRYRDRIGNRVVVGFEVLGVQRDGKPEPWFTEHIGNGVRVNTGNDGFLPVPADYTYTLHYRTDRQLGFFDDHDELYFNAIGTGWDFDIERGSVEVRLPRPVPVADLVAEAYTGGYGSRARDFDADMPAPGIARWTLTRPLAPGEGMTVALSFPKGVVAEPTRTQKAWWLLKDNSAVLIALCGLAVLLVFCFLRWRQVGRDPRPGVVVVRYDPPDGHSPADLRYVKRMGYDNRCFSSDLLLDAVEGRLRIRRDEQLLGDAWHLTSLGMPRGDAGDGRREVLAKLFADGPELELDNSNAKAIGGARLLHAKQLEKRFNP